MDDVNYYDYYYGDTEDNVIILKISNKILPSPIFIGELIEKTIHYKICEMTQLIEGHHILSKVNKSPPDSTNSR